MQSVILLSEIRKCWRYKWIAMGVALVVCSAGWFAVHLIPDKYESMARVYLDTQSMLKPVLRGLAIDSDVRSTVAETTRRTLLRRSNLEQLIRETDMDLKLDNQEEKERLILELSQSIHVSGGGRDNIYTISYQSKDALLAKKVVEISLDIFVETALGVVRKDSSMTEGFIDEQIDDYEARLTAAEERLKEFKRENVGFMPTEAGGYFQRLSAAVDDLDEVRLEYSEAENRRNVLAAQIEGEVPFMREAENQRDVQSPLDTRINAMRERLDDLLLQFTEQHPDVISVMQSIADLEQQKKKGMTFDGGPNDKVALVNSPIYQELKIEFAKAEADLSALSERNRIREKRVSELRGYIDKILRSEAELAKLNRDYEINKNNYEVFVGRREAAKITRDADQSVDSIQFKIIDPPVVALVPVFPNRPLFVTLVLMLGIGGGLGLAWLVSKARPTFDEPNEIRNTLGLPMLGGVSRLFTKADKRKRKLELVGFILLFMLLLVAYSMLIITHQFNIDLLGLV